MRGTLKARILSVAAALLLLTAGTATAQVREPVATPPPSQLPGIKTAVIQNATIDPNISAVIDQRSRFAHKEIGGRIGGKKSGYLAVTLPDPASVSVAASDLAQEGFDLAVISGGDSLATVGIARANPDMVFLDIDQPLPCVTQDGIGDPSGTCTGGELAIPRNYSAVDFAVDEAAYLAGVIAASASRRDLLGIISGTSECEECNRYIQGFALGAQSVKPEIAVQLAFLADEGDEAAFGDPVAAKTYAKAFIDVFEPEVVLPVAGAASRGIIEAACEAGIYAVGTEIDVSAVHPELEECILTSVTKDFGYAVREAIFSVANGDYEPAREFGLADGHVAATDEWTRLPGLPVELSERYAAAEQAIVTGLVDTCPIGCGARFGSDNSAETDVDPTTSSEADPAADAGADADSAELDIQD